MNDMVKKVRICADRLQNDLVEFASQLIRIPTVNPPGEHYEECIEAIGQRLDEMSIDWTRVDVPAEKLSELAPQGQDRSRPSIIGRWGQGRRELHFHGHYDVVPAFSEKQFDAYVHDGRLSGRGAADMKGGLASMLFAIQILQECGMRLDGTISYSITPDEETGGVAGLKYLLDSGHINQDIIGVLDPEPSSGDIINGSRGALSMEVIVKGKPSHVMLQHLGVNAFEKMVQAAAAFLELKNDVEKRITRCQVKPPGTGHSILHIGGLCGGGINFNIVPDRTFFTVDRRFNPEEKMSDVRRELEECVLSLRRRGIEVETRVFQEGESSLTGEDESVCRAMSQAIEGVLGRRPKMSICPGLLETRFFVERGIPAIIYGPGLLESAHHPDEYVRADDLSDCAAIYALTAAELLGKESP